ncbi:mucin-like protein [Actinia tenebrosa]|uniref:Mucin-like protein n=1 Tax=Actinia tenebrosa TaxID=6105 RepID=A0A6P8HCL4_ACTTE|nr:mucin-like protein [Actinia tenebrosa]
MYNYPKNGIQWSVPAEREDYGRYYNSKGLPVVGFNAGHGNDIYYDHPRSGDVMVVDIDQIEGLNVFKSPDSQTIQATGNGMQGRVFIRLEDSRGEEDHRLRCVNWYYQQGDARAFTQSLEPCPCSVWQAWRDRRFRFTMWSWFWGDPHFVTLDSKNYTFNGLGEYVMLDAKDGYFQLQARTSLAKGNGTATMFSGAVAKENNSVPVQVTLPYDNETMEVLVDGKPFDFKSLTNESQDLDNGSVTVSKPKKQCLEMSFHSGMSVTICEKQHILSIVTAAPESFKNKTKGLLGTWNGNAEDDFTLPNGTVLPHDMNGNDIHYKYGMAWQVTNETSLFTYKEGESSDTFLNKKFLPMFVEDLKFYNDSLKKEAVAKCNVDTSCLFDAASIGDVEIGLSTKQLGSQLVKDSKKMSKFSNSYESQIE